MEEVKERQVYNPQARFNYLSSCLPLSSHLYQGPFSLSGQCMGLHYTDCAVPGNYPVSNLCLVIHISVVNITNETCWRWHFLSTKHSKETWTALSEQQNYILGVERTHFNYANCGTHISMVTFAALELIYGYLCRWAKFGELGDRKQHLKTKLH
jgi:hypothetical protein